MQFQNKKKFNESTFAAKKVKRSTTVSVIESEKLKRENKRLKKENELYKK